MTIATSNSEGKAGAKICFVVMGFGKKTDYPSGRTLDLDATYTEVIKPVVESFDIRCVRADEIIHSGVIDVRMYEMLLRADLVVADISTGNQNAIYELGVRHALRPYSTIIMKESEGSFYFDLNHTSTLTYKHLGEDIGSREASRVRESLRQLIERALADPRADSPVYTYLPGLRTPVLTDEQVEEIVDESERSESAYFAAYEKANEYIASGNFVDAAEKLKEAIDVRRGEPYLIQQLALCTYKSKAPSEISSLIDAWSILAALDPEKSNDPETLGIGGSIKKRLWLLTKDIECLRASADLYGKGFEVRRDYYNGENYALCLNMLASAVSDDSEKSYYKIDARKVREKLKGVLHQVVDSVDFQDRSDKRWIYASLANTNYALGNHERGVFYENLFQSGSDEDVATWELDTYEESKNLLLSLINGDS